jgi:hypothetical protein
METKEMQDWANSKPQSQAKQGWSSWDAQDDDGGWSAQGGDGKWGAWGDQSWEQGESNQWDGHGGGEQGWSNEDESPLAWQGAWGWPAGSSGYDSGNSAGYGQGFGGKGGGGRKRKGVGGKGKGKGSVKGYFERGVRSNQTGDVPRDFCRGYWENKRCAFSSRSGGCKFVHVFHKDYNEESVNKKQRADDQAQPEVNKKAQPEVNKEVQPNITAGENSR